MSDLKVNKIKVGIIDMKLHNLFSIYQACKNIGYKTTIIDNKLKNYSYDIIILPGVGSFKSAMNYLNTSGIKDRLLEYSNSRNKFLFGICLGMQLLFDKSEEFGDTKGLGLISGDVKKFKKYKNVKIPHIGWNNLILGPNKNTFLKKNCFDHNFYFIP